MSSFHSAAAPVAEVDFEQLTAPAPREPAPSLESASQQARAIVASAEAEAARIREEARAHGFEEGFAAGRGEAHSHFAPTANAMAEALQGISQLQAEAADRVEAQAVDLSLKVAQKVLAGAIDAQPERLLDVVRGALRTIVERERVILLVHPDDLELMRDSIAEVTATLGGIDHIDVQEERRVHRGGAIVRTTFGEVDARIETKLERARQAIVEELAR
jgi:flagellar biosynthesis/type III secretory pathway protein FliH